MKTNEIAKVLKKAGSQPNEYSIGFKRLACLPQRVRADINLACVMKGESNTNSVKEFLNNLTEIEFANWLKLA